MAETNTQTVVRVLLSPSAALEAAFQQLLTERNVNTARGFILDLLGKLVGRPRSGESDDEVYRRYIRAQIATNKSDGTIGDILRVARMVVIEAPSGALQLENLGRAAYVLRVEGIALPPSAERVLVDLILRATAAGVRALVGYSLEAPSNVLRWSTPGRVWGTSKWSHITDRRS